MMAMARLRGKASAWRYSRTKQFFEDSGIPISRDVSTVEIPLQAMLLQSLRFPLQWLSHKDRKQADDCSDEQPAVEPTQTCMICSEDFVYGQFALPTSSCLHDPEYCRQCLERSITAELDTKGWCNLRCPDTDCQEEMEDGDVLRHAPGQAYERYSRLAALAVLSEMDDFHRCLAPGCESGQIHETGEDGPIFTCYVCGFKACTTHQVAWHEGETCKEYEYRTDGSLKRAEEVATEQTKQRTTKTCPKCASPIEKNDGCDHMTCELIKHPQTSLADSWTTGRRKGCGHEFCWLCLASYDAIRKGGNAKHERSCNYYRD